MSNVDEIQASARQLATKVAQTAAKEVTSDLVANAVKGIAGRVLEDTYIATLEALLAQSGKVIADRNLIWARALAEIVQKDVPANPTEVESVIVAWQAAREVELEKKMYQLGYEDGYRVAWEKGLKTGWAAHSVGYTMDETLERNKAGKS